MSPPSKLEEIQTELWQTLQFATAPDAKHGWRLPILATVEGRRPRTRTVVLRSIDPASRGLTIHTDVRSPKVLQLKSNSAVSVTFYDQATMEQLVVTGTASVHTDDSVADENWKVAAPSSRRGYLGILAPGTPTDGPDVNLPANVRGRVPSEAELAPARENFAAIVIAVESIEWLRLARTGNHRAVFRYDNEDLVGATWVAP